MSRSSSRLRRFGLAGLATLAALVAAPSAGATAYTVDAQCSSSSFGDISSQVGIDVPESVEAGASVVPLKVTRFTSPRLSKISDLLVSATLNASLNLPSGGARPLVADFKMRSTMLVDAGPVDITGEAGQATVVYTGLVIHLGSGWTGSTFEDVSCTLQTPTPSAAIVVTSTVQSTSFAYDLAGKATTKRLIAGSLPLKGSLGIDVTQAGAVTGGLVLPAATGRLNAMGFLPITVKVAFVPAGRLTGTYLDGALMITTKVRIKVTEAKIYGAIPLFAGNSCQTKSLSDLKLTSGAGFSLAAGGSLSGQFAMSDLNGCGLLNGLVDPRMASTGNTMTLQATPAVSQD